MHIIPMEKSWKPRRTHEEFTSYRSPALPSRPPPTRPSYASYSLGRNSSVAMTSMKDEYNELRSQLNRLQNSLQQSIAQASNVSSIHAPRRTFFSRREEFIPYERQKLEQEEEVKPLQSEIIPTDESQFVYEKKKKELQRRLKSLSSPSEKIEEEVEEVKEETVREEWMNPSQLRIRIQILEGENEDLRRSVKEKGERITNLSSSLEKERLHNKKLLFDIGNVSFDDSVPHSERLLMLKVKNLASEKEALEMEIEVLRSELEKERKRSIDVHERTLLELEEDSMDSFEQRRLSGPRRQPPPVPVVRSAEKEVKNEEEDEERLRKQLEEAEDERRKLQEEYSARISRVLDGEDKTEKREEEEVKGKEKVEEETRKEQERVKEVEEKEQERRRNEEEDTKRKEKEKVKQQEEEETRRQQQKEEEEETRKQQQQEEEEEETRRKQEEETRRKQEEETRKEEETRRKQEEETRRKQEEEDERLGVPEIRMSELSPIGEGDTSMYREEKERVDRELNWTEEEEEKGINEEKKEETYSREDLKNELDNIEKLLSQRNEEDKERMEEERRKEMTKDEFYTGDDDSKFPSFGVPYISTAEMIGEKDDKIEMKEEPEKKIEEDKTEMEMKEEVKEEPEIVDEKMEEEVNEEDVILEVEEEEELKDNEEKKKEVTFLNQEEVAHFGYNFAVLSKQGKERVHILLGGTEMKKVNFSNGKLSRRCVFIGGQSEFLCWGRKWKQKQWHSVRIDEIQTIVFGTDSPAFHKKKKTLSEGLVKPWLAFSVITNTRTVDFVAKEDDVFNWVLGLEELVRTVRKEKDKAPKFTYGRLLWNRAVWKVEEQCRERKMSRVALIAEALLRAAAEEQEEERDERGEWIGMEMNHPDESV